MDNSSFYLLGIALVATASEATTPRRATGLVLLVGLLGWLVYAKVTTQAAAEAQCANTEDLLSFMLGDLDRLGNTIDTSDATQEMNLIATSRLKVSS